MPKNNDKLKELLKQAEQGTKAVFESDNYRNYLATMSKFHSYSFRNSLLILMQKPEATHVAGYAAWKKKFNRQVQRGESSIQIVGYSPRKVNVEQEKKDSSGHTIIGADGKPVMERVTQQIPSYVPVSVFDVSQTEGEPLPQLVNELNGSVEAYQDLMQAIRDVSPFPVSFEEIHGGAKGFCDPVTQRIVIQQGMSEAQSVKTAIHEVTHADLHAPEQNLVLADRTDRRTREIEAESTAFVVCEHYGIDTSDYTFPYLASWSSSKELAELQSSLETIQKQAGDLIDKIDTRLTELQKDREKDLFTEITPDQVKALVSSFENKEDRPFGCYLAPENGKWTAVDDRTHDCWVETFPDRKTAIDWLSGKFEMSEYHDLSNNAPTLKQDNSPAPADRTFIIYQLKENADNRNIRFEGLDQLRQANIAPALPMYDKVYIGKMPAGKNLDDIFTEFNINRPADFTGHSLSVSDIIAIKDDFGITAHYVDSFGFENLPEFAQAIEDQQQEADIVSFEKYQGISSEEARRHEETLDTVRFDGDIDLDREKTREQLGFRDQDKEQPKAAPEPQKKISMKERMAAAQAEADRRNSSHAPDQPQHDKAAERGE